MVKVSVPRTGDAPKRRRNTIEPLVLADVPRMEEGQDLDFKRSVEMDKPELRTRLVGDVVASLNRGPGRSPCQSAISAMPFIIGDDR